jgi:hypothetical protein
VSLLVYDAFWVFYSPEMFNENVMVIVAQQRATNPVFQGARKFVVADFCMLSSIRFACSCRSCELDVACTTSRNTAAASGSML